MAKLLGGITSDRSEVTRTSTRSLCLLARSYDGTVKITMWYPGDPGTWGEPMVEIKVDEGSAEYPSGTVFFGFLSDLVEFAAARDEAREDERRRARALGESPRDVMDLLDCSEIIGSGVPYEDVFA